jgi:predicted enzyme related to lactoylglutathione lyase
MAKSPIKNKINLVFIPVTDIEKAKKWYSKMLGIEDGEAHFGHLFAAEMEEGSGMLLDTMPMWRNENGELPRLNVPAIQFGTDDVHASYQFLKENGVELVTEIQYDQFFVFKDLDGNMLMVCKD